ncbi:MAG TPA: Hsp20/alpha crystallin family protein [Thermoplasmata archaeon]|jgi:HSP20 family molecular chaperone IbpA|nr:Hsp20/alpha crystallin family protein [Thermoplasmata archaeon]
MGADDEFDEVRKMINRILSDAVQGKVEHDSEPIVRRTTERVHAEEKGEKSVTRRYLVQVPPDPGLPGPDVDASPEDVYVTLDLGGAAPTGVRTRLAGRLLLIEVEGNRPMSRVVELPCDVMPAARWTERGGVLDLRMRRRPPTAE